MTTLRRHRCRPRLECLEGRDTPSNLTVSFSGLTHTLTVVGDNLNNNLTVAGVAGDNTKFVLTSTSDTFNHNARPSPPRAASRTSASGCSTATTT
jgi:hypothetical protein